MGDTAVEISRAPSPEPRGVEEVVKSAEYIYNLKKRLAVMNGPVEFHGKVIDQQGQPVEGAKLKLNLSIYTESIIKALGEKDAVQNESIHLLTDNAGRFSLSGKRGSTLRLEAVEREDYLWLDPGLGSFEFRRDIPQQNRPYADPTKGITFQMWRKGVTEPVIQVHQRVRLLENKTDYPVNIFGATPDGVAQPTVDLLIRTPLAAPDDPNRPYDRWIILQAPGGGIQETQDVYPYAAPMAGYEKEWRKLYQPGGPRPDSEGWSRNYYLRTRSGRVYAGLTIRFAPGETAFVIDGILNPHGSRNLELDPAKQVTDPEEIRRLDAETSK